MKPLILKMNAFGPYADTQIIDFSELRGRSFFLIHGPTGAGKTTLLDAICFALYGDASGTQRDGKSLRSDYADPSHLTEVMFDFAVGTKQYRINRAPEQEKYKKRGEGVTLQPAKAVFWDITDGEEVLATGTSRVTAEVERILGFKSSQFRQVVLLPQGEFRKLLTADSKERQEIMQTLFKTELYSKIEDKLKVKAKELKVQYEQLVNKRVWLLQEAKAETSTALAERLAAHQDELTDLTKKVQVFEQELTVAQQKVTEAAVVEQKLTEFAQSQQALKLLEGQQQDIDMLRLQVSKANSAANLKEAENLLGKLKQELAQLIANGKAIKQHLIQAESNYDKAKQQFTEVESQEAQLIQAEHQVLHLNELTDKVKAYQSAQSTAAELKQQLQQTTELRIRLQDNVNKQQKTIEALQQEKERLGDVAANAAAFKAQYEEWQAISAKNTYLTKTRQQLAAAEQQFADSQKNLESLEKQYGQAQLRLGDIQLAFTANQALVMSAELVEGQACPVCGAVHHPQPAYRSGRTSEKVTDDDLKEQQSVIDELDLRRQKGRLNYSKCLSERDTLVNKSNDITLELGEYAALSSKEILASIATAQQAYQEALSAQNRIEEIKKISVIKTEQYKQRAENLTVLDEKFNLSKNEYNAAQAIANEREKDIPLELRNLEALQQAQIAAKSMYQRLKSHKEKIFQTMQDSKAAVDKYQAAYQQAREHYLAKQAQLSSEETDFTVRLKTAGFAEYAAYQQAKKDDKARNALEIKVKQYENSLAAAKDRVTRACDLAKDLILPDIAVLQRELDDRREKYSTGFARKTEVSSNIKQEQEWLNKFQQIDTEYEALAQKYAIMGRLSEVANGVNDFGITFQRFVLGALLDDVADAANQRLKTMSRGRYLLGRTMDRATKRSAGGLDLEVFDNFTGYSRSVATLSGGETFLASLSLALGLADVVQSYAGGIHLDTIFVDEGFGTLDPESLDFAIKALIDLQKGGRLVGIISHVPELKERIDARLEIALTDKGSTASFKVN